MKLKEKRNEIVGELITLEKYKFIPKGLIADIVDDLIRYLGEEFERK